MIRTLWGERSFLSTKNATILFFVGRTKSRIAQIHLEMEHKQFRDIIQFDIIDVYEELVYKCITMMTWFDKYCTNTDWFVKADVDSFWNVYQLYNMLQSNDKDLSITRYIDDIKIIRKNYLSKGSDKSQIIYSRFENEIHNNAYNNGTAEDKYSTEYSIICAPVKVLSVCRYYSEDICEERYLVGKDEYAANSYPPHCHGFSYALRSNLIKKILEADFNRLQNGLSRFRMEDVYITGMLAATVQTALLDIS